MINEVRLLKDFETFVFTDNTQKRQYRDLLNYLIEQQVTNSGWVSCKDKLPEIGERVLCCTKGGRWNRNNIFVAKYCAADKFNDKPYFDWDRNGFPNVLAWQPLPNSYIEGDT